MDIDITPPPMPPPHAPPMPPAGPLRTAPAWGGVGGAGDNNIHIDISINIDIDTIISRHGGDKSVHLVANNPSLSNER